MQAFLSHTPTINMYTADILAALLAIIVSGISLQKQNELEISPEEKVDFLMSKLDGHCNAINKENMGTYTFNKPIEFFLM